MKRISPVVLIIILIILSFLSIDVYAADCFGKGESDCKLDPPITCVPHERDWELYGADAYTAYCALGKGLYPRCMEVETGSYCSEWYDCDDECEDCVLNESWSFKINDVIFY